MLRVRGPEHRKPIVLSGIITRKRPTMPWSFASSSPMKVDANPGLCGKADPDAPARRSSEPRRRAPVAPIRCPRAWTGVVTVRVRASGTHAVPVQERAAL